MILAHWTYMEAGALCAFLALAFVAGVALARLGLRRRHRS